MSISIHHDPELEFALEAVRTASELVKSVQIEMVKPTTLTKSDRSPVTIADLASQAIVSFLLEKKFPKDPLVSEEDSKILSTPEGLTSLKQVTNYVRQLFPEVSPQEICRWIDRGTAQTSKRFWTLDPIDGTKGFLRGDQYAVALALIIDGTVELGVMGCPNLKDAKDVDAHGPGSLIFAKRGHGAWTTSIKKSDVFSPLHVSAKKDVSGIIMLRSLDTEHTHAQEMEAIRKYLGIESPPFLMDSLAKYAILSSGKADLYFRLLSPNKPDYREYIWDQACGVVILEEAGGRVTDLDGKPLDFTTGRKLLNNRGVLASNGFFHEKALEAIQKLRC